MEQIHAQEYAIAYDRDTSLFYATHQDGHITYVAASLIAADEMRRTGKVGVRVRVTPPPQHGTNQQIWSFDTLSTMSQWIARVPWPDGTVPVVTVISQIIP